MSAHRQMTSGDMHVSMCGTGYADRAPGWHSTYQRTRLGVCSHGGLWIAQADGSGDMWEGGLLREKGTAEE